MIQNFSGYVANKYIIDLRLSGSQLTKSPTNFQEDL